MTLWVATLWASFNNKSSIQTYDQRSLGTDLCNINRVSQISNWSDNKLITRLPHIHTRPTHHLIPARDILEIQCTMSTRPCFPHTIFSILW